MLVEKEQIIVEDKELAQTFNDFFDNAVKSLGINENNMLLTEIHESQGKVMDAIKMYENHPSIIEIKKHIVVGTKFTFSPVTFMVSSKPLTPGRQQDT